MGGRHEGLRTAAEVFGCLFDATLDAFVLWDIDENVLTMTADGTYSAVLFNSAGRDLRTSLYLPTSGHIVRPASGPLAGGTSITLTGVGLDLHGATPTVEVGGVAATDVVVADSNTIQAVTPAGVGAGPVDVVVTGTDPAPYIWPGGFTYDAVLAGARAEPAGTRAGIEGCATAPTGRGAGALAIAMLALVLACRRRRPASPPRLHSHAVPAVLPSRSSRARWKAPGP